MLAAPVLALWAAYRNAPEAGETDVLPTVAAHEAQGSLTGDRLDGRPYENAGNARPTSPRPDPRSATARRTSRSRCRARTPARRRPTAGSSTGRAG
ncbi:hypothetical protein O1L55_07300 [Streptomyces albulus]|nr:hypothetical protein [Streptomyces noursei]